jgi:excisionase family DNA binding protein
LLTVAEVQERLRISRRTAYRLIERGDIPALRIGGSLRVDSAELEAWLYREEGE